MTEDMAEAVEITDRGFMIGIEEHTLHLGPNTEHIII